MPRAAMTAHNYHDPWLLRSAEEDEIRRFIRERQITEASVWITRQGWSGRKLAQAISILVDGWGVRVGRE